MPPRMARKTGDPAELYWLQATLGEAALIRGEINDAIKWYTQAGRGAVGRYGDLASTRRNARLLFKVMDLTPTRSSGSRPASQFPGWWSLPAIWSISPAGLSLVFRILWPRQVLSEDRRHPGATRCPDRVIFSRLRLRHFIPRSHAETGRRGQHHPPLHQGGVY